MLALALAATSPARLRWCANSLLPAHAHARSRSGRASALAWNLFSGYIGAAVVRPRGLLRPGRLHRRAAATCKLRHHALDRHPGRGAVGGRRRPRSSAIPTFRLRGHYFALAMLAYPLALLYVFEWLGYQEVSLPMKRENAGRVHAVRRHRASTSRSAVAAAGVALAHRRCSSSARASACRCSPSSRTSPPPRPRASTRCAGSCSAIVLSAERSPALAGGVVRRRAARRDAGSRVRHAGLGAGADRHLVRRRRHRRGAR